MKLDTQCKILLTCHKGLLDKLDQLVEQTGVSRNKLIRTLLHAGVDRINGHVNSPSETALKQWQAMKSRDWTKV